MDVVGLRAITSPRLPPHLPPRSRCGALLCDQRNAFPNARSPGHPGLLFMSEAKEIAVPGRGKRQSYLILPSLNSTCLRTLGSYFLTDIFSVMVRVFFFVT